ncbi:MAG: PKD domain-containing protein [Gemmatimonadota bacterium]
MRTSIYRGVCPALLVIAGFLAAACSDAIAPTGGSVAFPESLLAEPVDLTTARVQWARVEGAGSYQLERRSGLNGAFSMVASDIPSLQTSFLDTSLSPETFYGYRVRARSSLGERSPPSVVVGIRTPPVPGILARTSTSNATPRSADPDGYTVVIRGATDTLRLPIEVNAERRVSPLPSGQYEIELQGLANNCSADSVKRSRTVTDQGLATVQVAAFDVTCRDPGQGRLLVSIVVAGDSLDADGYGLSLTGIPDDHTLPVVTRILTVPTPEGISGLVFDQLPAGSYSLELTNVAGNCTVTGGATSLDIQVPVLSDALARFDINCVGGGQAGRPFIWKNQWVPTTASTGASVELDVTLDMTADAAQTVGAIQAEVGFDQSVVHYDSIAPDRLQNIVDNASAPGKIVFGAFTTTAAGRSGSVRVARLFFTVIGGIGQTTRTQTRNVQASSSSNSGAVRFDSQIGTIEATFTTGTAASNQPPVAQVNGPYAGTPGVPVTFSSASSSDPDGSIDTFEWNFGDGSSGTGVSPAHSYANPGSYTVTLTVTDNLGATGQNQTTVTIAGSGGNQPPVAESNGPYTGSAGTAIGFSSAGSFDPDGTIASYQWAFGDGASGAGQNPVHVYAASGTYTATLTVTDNSGSVASDGATVSVGPAAASPITWSESFGSINPVDSMVTLTVTLDLTTDIPETPGQEALETWSVSLLQWNPAVLRYSSFNFGPGGFGSVDPTLAISQGRLVFNGMQPSANSTGVVTLATIRFKVIGASASSTTTATTLGNLIGTSGTGGYNYRTKTTVTEGTITAP